MARLKRRVAEQLAWVTLALQATLLLALMMTNPALPARIGLLELLWAASRRPIFYVLVAALVAGPVLTLVAWRVPGRHRTWLGTAWPAFLTVLLVAHGQRVALMIHILWQRGG